MIGAGASVGAAAACKYSGLIVLGAVGVGVSARAYPRKGVECLFRLDDAKKAPDPFPAPCPLGAARAWCPIVVAQSPSSSSSTRWCLQYPGKFLRDFKEQITDPLLGAVRPIFMAQFADIPESASVLVHEPALVVARTDAGTAGPRGRSLVVLPERSASRRRCRLRGHLLRWWRDTPWRR